MICYFFLFLLFVSFSSAFYNKLNPYDHRTCLIVYSEKSNRERVLAKLGWLFKSLMSPIISLSFMKDEVEAQTARRILDESAKLKILNGKVYVHENFITEDMVNKMRQEIAAMVKEGRFKISGLSNAVLGSNQGFDNRDRTICPVPVYDAKSFQPSVPCTSVHKESAFVEVSSNIMSLRNELAILLNRPSLDDNSLGHEAYFSRYTVGNSLKRHLDEKHEEIKGNIHIESVISK